MLNFPDGAIKPGVVNGNEVINVLSWQTKGFREGTRTSPGEKDQSCAFVIMQQQVSEQGAQLVPIYTVGKHDRQSECTHCPGEGGAFS